MVPHTPENWRRYAAACIAAALLAAGCGGPAGARKAAPPSKAGAPPSKAGAPPTKNGAPPTGAAAAATMSAPQMCNDLSDLHNLFAQVGFDTTLAAVKRDFGNLVATARKDLSVQPPKAVAAPVERLVVDLTAVYQWVQTTATQKDLNDNTMPPSVKTHFDDVGTQYKQIDSWSAKNCR